MVGTPQAGQDGGYPKVGNPPGQGRYAPVKDLLRSRRHASCIHAGGLFVLFNIWKFSIWQLKQSEKFEGIEKSDRSDKK